MKRILILIPFSFLFASCGNSVMSNNEKAKALIEKYMNSSLNDPNSYESVSYDTLDSLFIDPHEKKMIDDMYELSGDIEEYKAALAAQKKAFSGFHITHTFRFKNTNGGIETHTWDFNFNKPLTDISNIEKMNDR